MFMIAFPLLLIPFALYNMIAFLLGMDFGDEVFSIPMLSGEQVAVRTGDILILLGVLLLYVEIVKATRLANRAIMDHALSLILFMVMAVEFVTEKRAATSTFLILTALSFVDVIGGFSVTIGTARHDVNDVNIESSERVTPVH